MREMTVYGVSFDLVGKQPIVLLKTADENKFLPIWIGHPEAAAILMKLQGASPQRPMTHDLMSDLISELDAEVTKITVTELRENTFYAQITIERNGSEIQIDSRPSDAIALAVRVEAKIFAADDVIDESGIEFESEEEAANDERIRRVSALGDVDPAEFRAFLDTVTPEDFAEGLEEEES
jgi:bifunctional DNase/RNase